jgi:hypothetical protein
LEMPGYPVIHAGRNSRSFPGTLNCGGALDTSPLLQLGYLTYPQLLYTIRFYLFNKYITVVVIGLVDKWIKFPNNLFDITFIYACTSLPRGFHVFN